MNFAMLLLYILKIRLLPYFLYGCMSRTKSHSLQLLYSADLLTHGCEDIMVDVSLRRHLSPKQEEEKLLPHLLGNHGS